MNLASHYAPFLRAAPPKVIRVLGLGAVLALTLGAGSAGARTAETAPPLDGGAHCSLSVKPHYSLNAVAKGGMPVNVTCDAPARVQVTFELNRPSPQARALTRMFPHDNPGICRSRDVGVGTGTTVLRPELMPYGARVAGHYRRTKVIVHLLSLREDGFFWSEGTIDRHTLLVRR